MVPYRDPTSQFDVFGPSTALTGKIVAHGGGQIGATQRVLKGNPVGWMQHADGRYYPYFSARMEHSHQPVEHAMLGSVDLDHYGLGQVMPRTVQNEPPRQLQWGAQFRLPDTSVSSAFRPHTTFGGLSHPGQNFGPGESYDPNEAPQKGKTKQGWWRGRR